MLPLKSGIPLFTVWEHMSSFGEHIRFLDGFVNGTLILPYLNESDSYQDNGIYMCTVNNGADLNVSLVNSCDIHLIQMLT
jgi:hypothetical protein